MMIRSVALAAVFSIAAAGAACAQGATTTPADVRPGAYRVEPAHTQVLWSVSHEGFTTYYGTFSDASGDLKLDPHNPADSTVSITIPVASVATTSPALTEKLKGSAWFNAAAYPAMTFTSTSVTLTGNRAAKITGNLTMHGFTHPVTLNATFNAAGTDVVSHAYTVGFEASTQISRSRFGINTYVPLIGDDVTITITAAFVPK